MKLQKRNAAFGGSLIEFSLLLSFILVLPMASIVGTGTQVRDRLFVCELQPGLEGFSELPRSFPLDQSMGGNTETTMCDPTSVEDPTHPETQEGPDPEDTDALSS
ncbi:MAG: hypothetical protein KDD64_17410 [Bdellovibrionales bacterium]|nr:hypothetical protein [Bdellovibrionales bacterium]